MANALISYVRYLGKMVWPEHLAGLYLRKAPWPAWQVGLAAIALVAVSVAVIRLARRRPYLAVGWFWYLGTLVPVIGLVQVGMQSMADRYSYIPLIGIFIALAWGGWELASRWCSQGRSADFQSAVSRISNPQSIGTHSRRRQVRNLRYGRLEICATRSAASRGCRSRQHWCWWPA